MAALVLAGCKTTYVYTAADGREMRIESYREFPGGIDITYTDEGLRIQAGEVTNGGDVAAVVGLVEKIIPLIPATQTP